MSGPDDEEERELRRKAWEERSAIVEKYDIGREEGAVIDDWEDPKLEIYHTQDRFGFIHDKRLPEMGRNEREERQKEKEMSRLDKWLKMIKSPDKFFQPQSKNRDTMAGRVWKGVPQRMRGELWKILLNINTIKEQQDGTYVKMKTLARQYSPDIRQIDLDVNRTYRNHTMFRERYNVKQQDLFHVLAAYSMYNTEVGYCQGMSQIAALLLMYLLSEEDAFWGLHMLMVGGLYKMHGFFIPHFPKLIRFQEHYEKILTKKLGRLHKHLVKNGVDSGIYTLKWFFQCFLDRLPFSLVIRVWDLYLLEGEVIMFAMAYTILKLHRQRLLKMGMDDLLEFLQKTLESNFGFDDDFVIETALRQNLLELKSSRLHSAGEAPPNEEPVKPFGMVRQASLEEELGYRQPFNQKEREVSHYTIQREEDNVRKLQHLNSQNSIDEGSFDHSLNETGSVEPETEDRHSDLLEQDISLDSPTCSGGRTPVAGVDSSSSGGRPSAGGGSSSLGGVVGRSGSGQQLGGPRSSPSPLPPSPLPPSKEQDELDESLIFMMKAADISGVTPLPRPASADPRPIQHSQHLQEPTTTAVKRHSAHVNTSDYKHSQQHHAATMANHQQRLQQLQQHHQQLLLLQHQQQLSPGLSSHSNSFSSGHQANSRRHGEEGEAEGIPAVYYTTTTGTGGGGVKGSRSNSTSSGRPTPRGRSDSSSSRPASTALYYYGENPHEPSQLPLPGSESGGAAVHHQLNGHDRRARGEEEVEEEGGEEDILNSSFEGATAHKGEVVRIRVPYSAGESPGQEEIQRQDMEISPRYNGHRVTIQVNQSDSTGGEGGTPGGGSGEASRYSGAAGGVEQRPGSRQVVASKQVTQRRISTSERKESSRRYYEEKTASTTSSTSRRGEARSSVTSSSEQYHQRFDELEGGGGGRESPLQAAQGNGFSSGGGGRTARHPAQLQERNYSSPGSRTAPARSSAAESLDLTAARRRETFF